MTRVTGRGALTAMLALTCAGACVLAEPEADRVLLRAIDAYRGVESYADQVQMRFEMVAEGAGGADMSETDTEEMSFAFARPNKVSMRAEDASVVSDGTSLWMSLGWLGQYTKADAPEVLDLFSLSAEGMIPFADMHPIVRLVMEETEPGVPMLHFMEETTKVEPSERDGKAGKLVTGTTTFGGMFMGQSVDSQAWFDDLTGMVGWVRIDFTKAYRAMLGLDEAGGEAKADAGDADLFGGGPTKIDKADMSLTIGSVRLNEALPADTFDFEPAVGMQEVKAFDFGAGMQAAAQDALIGKDAPPFEGSLLDGAPFKLADLKGQVVLLDFWATWCGPCVRAIPLIQGLSERYKDKPVRVVGINQDQGDTVRVSDFVKDKGITFAQFMDADNGVGMKYGVSAIPCMVLIGKNGKVQEVHVGFRPDEDAKLAESIDKLLEGKDLFAGAGEGG